MNAETIARDLLTETAPCMRVLARDGSVLAIAPDVAGIPPLAILAALESDEIPDRYAVASMAYGTATRLTDGGDPFRVAVSWVVTIDGDSAMGVLSDRGVELSPSAVGYVADGCLAWLRNT